MPANDVALPRCISIIIIIIIIIVIIIIIIIISIIIFVNRPLARSL